MITGKVKQQSTLQAQRDGAARSSKGCMQVEVISMSHKQDMPRVLLFVMLLVMPMRSSTRQ